MALLLLVPPFAAQAESGDRDPRGHSLLESEGHFGVRTRAERRWLWETDSARRGSISEAELIHRLTSKPGKRRMGGRGLGQRVYIWLKRTSRYIEQGDYGTAYRSLGHVPSLARTYQRQTHHIHTLMSDLAARYVIAGDLDRAVRIYEEMLLLGRYLPPRFTGASLNKRIAMHFDLGDRARGVGAMTTCFVLGDRLTQQG
ncbi:MAG: hypothetical protein OXG82_00680 [Gammaproteobacteria bacterium]|nr:hypothetical protein [Gammaproteobacteria bacterium]